MGARIVSKNLVISIVLISLLIVIIGVLSSNVLASSGGQVSNIIITTDPTIPMYADGSSNYIIHIKALDNVGNPVPNTVLTVVIDNSHTISHKTDTNGILNAYSGPSFTIGDFPINVTADNGVNNSTTIRFIQGPPAAIGIVANPNVVASADISTPPHQPDVHITTIVATITDAWGHPISKDQFGNPLMININSADSNRGNITDTYNGNGNLNNGIASGFADSNGQFMANFTLGDNAYGINLAKGSGVPVKAWLNSIPSINSSCEILYTNQPLVVASTSIAPMYNLSINDTINVSVNMRAIGWFNGTVIKNSSVILLFDTSGSMDWMSNTSYPINDDNAPAVGNMSQISVPLTDEMNNWIGVNDSDWQPVYNYTYVGNSSSGVTDLQIILSSDYRSYKNGSFYYLKVVDPSNISISTDTPSDGYTRVNGSGNNNGNGVSGKYGNENCIDFATPTNGTYAIYGAYVNSSSALADVPYNMMILTNAKRLGDANETNTAAKSAGSVFVSKMNNNNNEVGIVWFNNSKPLANFTGDIVTGISPLNVQFNDTSLTTADNNISSWQWNFGDGTQNSTAQNPLHSFVNYGSYTVTLTVTNDGGSSTMQKVGYITVLDLPPVTDFTASPRSGIAPLYVQFTDNSTGNNINSWQWNFGDGSDNATAKNPNNYYYNFGNYTVILTVSNDGGNSTVQKVEYINVHDPAPTANFTYNKTIGNAPLSVQFTNTSTGNNITSWQWDFGDGSTATTMNPVHTFTSYGTYIVTLTVTNNGGSSTKLAADPIIIHDAAPVAGFTSNVTTGIAPLTVQFNDSSIGDNITSWQWNFGDGTLNNTATNPVHVFNSFGNYTVTLTVTNDGGSSSTQVVKYITIHDVAPQANFTSTPPITGTAPLTVQFTDSSIGNNITSWQWNFGDLTANSTSTNPAHTFTSYGTYTVTLTVANNGGSSTAQKVGYITVYDPAPSADFTTNVTSGNAPLTVLFTNMSAGKNITAWQWNFGDGTGNVTTQNPVHTFTNFGTYTITLTVTNDGGSASTQKANWITVHDPAPSANFSGTPVIGNTPLRVQFTDSSLGNNITTWQWNFGDGTANNTTKNPVHFFTNLNGTNATYTVILTVTNDGGSSTIQKVSYITVSPLAPVASFNSNIQSGNAPLSVVFTDTSSNPATWQWNFGDGTANVTTQNVTHTFNAVGIYNVTLTVTNFGGSSTMQKLYYITVYNAKPVANFVATPAYGTSQLLVQLNDTSTGNNITSWQWNFGDGSPNSTSRNNTHTFINNNATNDTRNVILTVTNDGGSSSKKITIPVGPQLPVANFTATPTSGNTGMKVQFTDASSGVISSRQWNYGEGTNGTSTNPSHIYNTAGTYNVTLTVINPGGYNTMQKIAYIVVHNATPTVSFTANQTSGIGPLPVQFTVTSTGNNITWQWNFGDGTGNSSIKNALHVFNNTGVYTVTLTAINDGGFATAQIVNYITVYDPKPIANFTGVPQVGSSPLTVQFTDTSVGNNITSWQWNFGDGYSNSTQTNPVHTYNSYGNYTVTLTVVNNNGQSTAQKIFYITVHDPAPIADFYGTPTYGPVHMVVQFVDTSIGNNITSWQWNFGDGTPNSTQTDPKHMYNLTGYYSVTLTVTNDGGSSSITKVNYIYVVVTPSATPTASPTPTPTLKANFTSNVTSGIVPLSVQFTDTSTGLNINYWQYNFGDGSMNSSQPNPVHVFNAVGNYTVTLTVKNDTASSTVQKIYYITVHNPLPVANFTSNITTGNAPLAVQFTDTSTGYNIYGWQWNFGDGTGNVSTQNPVHTYATPGNYTVKLTVTNDGGSSTKVITSYIVVKDTAPVANFTSNTTVGSYPLGVQFTDTSTGTNIASWQWNFGDGTSNSTTQNPAHTYANYGTYTVTLTVTNSGGISTTQKVGYITVHDPLPVASFTSNVTSGASPLNILFSDTSSGNNITAWQWNFSDGTGNYTTKNPVHTFVNNNATNATFTVTLTVTNDGGSSTKVITNDILVVPQKPSANFNEAPTTGNAPLSVQFTDASSGGISTWQWNFGDGTGNVTTQSPLHVYNNPGTYPVTLTVANVGGSSTKQVLSCITVHNATPVASFTGVPTSGNSPLSVQFTDTSTGANINAWQWNFGDGTGNGTTKNPLHTYYNNNAVNVTYTVILTATNDGGSSSKQITNYITVVPSLPVANFSANTTVGNAPLSVQFTDAGTGASSWQWNFGDGSSNSTAQNPVHAYSTVGNYTVTLTETNLVGSSTKQVVNYITVHNPAPTANFIGTPITGNSPLSVQFNDTSSGANILSRQWSFGDATANSTSTNPAHTYSSPGSYTVILTVTNDGGSSTKKVTSYITVNNPVPSANFVGTPTTGNSPLSVQFNDTSSGSGITSWQWNFGDLTGNATTQNPAHIYNSPGTYAVTLTVTNNGGSSTKQVTNYITVHNATPIANFVGTPILGNSPLLVQFTESTNDSSITSWQWNFGDGTGNATTKNPAHTYNSYGTYAVTLTVTNDGGSSTKQITNYITVHDAAPVASFTANVTSGLSPVTAQFTDTSTGNNITSWQWNFGDGTANVTTKNPVHTFNNMFNYTVTLTVTNDGGSSTIKKVSYIVVHNPLPTANFTASPQYGAAPLTVQFTDTSTGSNIYLWQWDFGDGSPIVTQPNPVHTFNNVLNYTVTMTITNDGGSNATHKLIVVQTTNSTSPPVFALLARLVELVGPVYNADAQSVVTDIVDTLTPHTAAGTTLPLTPVDNSTTTQIDNKIDTLSSGGGTNIGAGISQAIAELNNSTKDNKKLIILLTDGYSQNPANDIAQAEIARENNITIDTIGMGMPDVDTLNSIAEETGGYYYKASNEEQLNNVYTNIAYNLTANATTWSNISIYSNCSQTYGPDTIYVNNSSWVTTYNTVTGITTHNQIEPNVIDNGTTYRLSWNPGNLSYAQLWNVEYQLRLNRSGGIIPIMNNSYVESDNGTQPLPETPLFVNDTTSNPPDIHVHITWPTTDSYPINASQLKIQWVINYTGTGTNTTDLTIYRNISSQPFLSVKKVSGSSYNWNLQNVPIDNYVIEVSTTDSVIHDSDTRYVYVTYRSGQIQIQ